MNIYWDVCFNTVAWCMQQSAIFYPFLLVLAFSVVGCIAFLIKYIIKGGL